MVSSTIAMSDHAKIPPLLARAESVTPLLYFGEYT